MDKKKLKGSLYFLAISLIIVLYLSHVVEPFCEANVNFSEGSTINLRERAILFVMSIPVLLTYLVYTLKVYENLKYFSFLNYPLSIMITFALFFYSFLGIVGLSEYFLIVVFLRIGAIIYTIVMMIIGIGQDIKSWKAYIENKKR